MLYWYCYYVIIYRFKGMYKCVCTGITTVLYHVRQFELTVISYGFAPYKFHLI